MANEYLKRQPTSSGNSRRWTLSFWMKNSDPTQGYTAIIGAGKLSPTNVYNEIFYNSSKIGLNLDNSSASDNYNITANPLLRDPSSWMHVIVSFTDQGDNANTRIKFYINGGFVDHNTGTGLDVSETSFFNDADYIHYIGSRAQQSAGTTTFDGQYFDVFLVDGQALTPDVFGFYKDGDGYISAGTTQSTDFKPGQWSPHSPTKIKKDVNRRGGFGVNGYYLPMNDSSNPGADFHCAPNSIITLKGEDLPQPRNGAPTTSDAYVSELRQETGTLGFDGVASFDGSGDYLSIPKASFQMLHKLTSSWTIEGYIFKTADTQGTLFDTGGSSSTTIGTAVYINSGGDLRLRIRQATGATVVSENLPGSVKLNRWQHIAVSYDGTSIRIFVEGRLLKTVSYNTQSSTDSSANFNIGVYDAQGGGGLAGYFTGFISNLRVIDGTALYTANFTAPTEPLTNVTNTKLLCCNSSTSATAATVTPGTITANGNVFATRNELTGSIVLAVPGIAGGQGSGYGDYSADIKGSGTNKTLTANGNAAVASVSSYYGSAMTFDGTGDHFRTTSNLSDFHFGTGDFTVEAWIFKSADGNNQYDGLIALGQNGSANDGWFLEISDTRGILFAIGSNYVQHNIDVNKSQWQHVAVERYNGRTTIYYNGIASANATTLGSPATTGTVLDIGAYGLDGVSGEYYFNGQIQDVRVYKGLAKYKGGFDVPKPYTPVGIEAFRTVADTCKNNFATLNPLGSGAGTFSNGNLTYHSSADTGNANMAISTGNFYCEGRVSNASPANGYIGIMDATEQNPLRAGGWNSHGAIAYKQNGDQYLKPRGGSTATSSYGASYTTGDIIGIACDVTNNTVTFYKNGVSQGTTSQGPSYIQSNGTFTLLFYGNTVEWNINFGQNPSFSGTTTAGTNTDGNGKGLFKYAVPSGFLALCEDNLPTPAIADPGKHFKTVLYTGDGNVGHSIAGVGFQSDLVWLKERSSTSSHQWHDSVRGAGNPLFSNSTAVESYSATYLYSLDSDGFTLGTSGGVNASTDTYVAWCWKAGGAAVTNNDGTITSQVSANQTAGFSIVSLNTGSGGNFTVGHGLANAPKFFITKARNQTYSWTTYHHSIGNDKYVYLNSTAAPVTTTSVWQNTAPSSSVIYGNSTNWGTADYIIYAWAEIEGYSKFGSYIGNGNTDGPFVYCGFKPVWVMYKRTDTTGNWAICDSSRNSINPLTLRLFADNSNADTTGVDPFDFVSNGFKFRTDAGSANANNGTYIFMAFAESPFQTANAK